MSVWTIGFTLRGAGLAKALAEALPEARAYALAKFAPRVGAEPVESLRDWCRAAWEQAEGIVFVGAAGIAVRTVAPFLRSKTTDPAVAVADEAGRFVISLLSGHIGGANALTCRAAELLGATPVITTATDVNGRFAVDVFAVRNRLAISSMKKAKEVSAAILAGEQVGLHTDLPLEGTVPPELALGRRRACNVEIGLRAQYPDSLLLIPRTVYLGVGCKRGTPAAQIETAVKRALETLGIPRQALAGAASVDLKADEPGLLDWAARWQLPVRFYTAAELREAPGEFTGSDFVRAVTGVDSVCERAAVLASEGGTLILRKQAADGVTVAAARREVRLEL